MDVNIILGGNGKYIFVYKNNLLLYKESYTPLTGHPTFRIYVVLKVNNIKLEPVPYMRKVEFMKTNKDLKFAAIGEIIPYNKSIRKTTVLDEDNATVYQEEVNFEFGGFYVVLFSTNYNYASYILSNFNLFL